jgi:hypothetical protein
MKAMFSDAKEGLGRGKAEAYYARAEEEIKRIEELKMDAEILEMHLSFCMDLLEETAQRLLSLHEAPQEIR